MNKPNTLRHNLDGISSLNELLEARELTGQIPETIPIGIKIKKDGDCCQPTTTTR